MSLAITIDGLERRKGDFHLGPVSIAVEAGARVAIVGPSGSGKTTLLRCLAGLERPDAGTIRIGDRIADDTDTQLPPDQRSLGLVFQDGALWPHMHALQHLRFAAPGLSKRDAMQLLERGGIAGQAKKKPAAMSGGEAQRLGLLRALAPAPAVLLLDEPLRSVDVHQRDGLVLLLRTLFDERNVTTILVTHDRDEALALADHLIVMRDGVLVEQGPSAALLEAPATAFTAAFLRGAACLSAKADGHGRVATAFGSFPHAADAADVRLVVFPGEVSAGHAEGPKARVLATLPGDDGTLRMRVACEDQILIARATEHATSTTTHLRLDRAPRLLPWSTTP